MRCARLCMVLDVYVHTSNVRGMDVWMYGCMYDMLRMDVSWDGWVLACLLLAASTDDGF